MSYNVMANDAVISMGERLFNDQRFSQFFYKKSGSNVNFKLTQGSPELDQIDVYGENFESPFKGQAMSCASCHMVDQAFDLDYAGMRGYSDFSVRTKIPARTDGKTHTLRNTPSLVGIGSKFNQNRLSHYDGEFFDHSETVLGNFTGRNMGWKKSEKDLALKNIVNIIRNDNGSGDLAQEFGGPYRKVLLGIDPSIPDEFKLPKDKRVDVLSISDDALISMVVDFVTAYLDSLNFETNEAGEFIGSPYDEFLKINNISAAPKNGQSILDYTRELLRDFSQLESPKFVKAKYYNNHKKSFEFGAKEWEGLQVFFNLYPQKSNVRGMCMNCHMPPLFTDQKFHNIGVTQKEYDQVHGKGSFYSLKIPDYQQRKKDQFYLARPDINDPQKVDLGVWNFFARKDKVSLTQLVKKMVCFDEEHCTNEYLLPTMIARFKTPSLRNLGHSAPYLHNGSAPTLEAVLEQYLDAAKLTKAGRLRNGAPQLRMMNIKSQHIEPLKAFLKALNENYE